MARFSQPQSVAPPASAQFTEVMEHAIGQIPLFASQVLNNAAQQGINDPEAIARMALAVVTEFGSLPPLALVYRAGWPARHIMVHHVDTEPAPFFALIARVATQTPLGGAEQVALVAPVHGAMFGVATPVLDDPVEPCGALTLIENRQQRVLRSIVWDDDDNLESAVLSVDAQATWLLTQRN